MAAGAVWEGLRKAVTRSFALEAARMAAAREGPLGSTLSTTPQAVSPIQPAAPLSATGRYIRGTGRGGVRRPVRRPTSASFRAGRARAAVPTGVVIEKRLGDPWTPELHFRPPTHAPSTIVPPYAGGSVAGVPCRSSVAPCPSQLAWKGLGRLPSPTPLPKSAWWTSAFL